MHTYKSQFFLFFWDLSNTIWDLSNTSWDLYNTSWDLFNTKWVLFTQKQKSWDLSNQFGSFSVVLERNLGFVHQNRAIPFLGPEPKTSLIKLQQTKNTRSFPFKTFLFLYNVTRRQINNPRFGCPPSSSS
jgi:hypothetical protein